MYKTLSPWAIGVAAPDLDSAIAAAKQGGFQGVEVNGAEVLGLVDQLGGDAVRAKFADAGIRPASFGLPIDWRTADAESLAKLGRIARACSEIGCTRTCTFIMPCSDELDLEANRKVHVAGLSPLASVLAEHGCSLGFEFIGPKTFRDSRRYPFIYQMGPMMEMAREIGPNTGLLLDAWHWYTSGGTVAEIEALSAADVVYVHVNDAPEGIDRDAQIDNVRRLPASTGVIDGAGFMRALQRIGYEGPVTPEPFSKELTELPSDADRLRVVGESMDRLFGYLDPAAR
ncbi:MAG TPA: sugar phosphate isomerase/epimerase family protein [Fimbriimonadaceae bacterium]|nr:sugar phosphate isomerase/epimerase family protein [Fimbriimonadaceae bacterium]